MTMTSARPKLRGSIFAFVLIVSAIFFGAASAIAAPLDSAVVPAVGSSVDFGAVAGAPISWTVDSVSGAAGSYTATLSTPLSGYDLGGEDPNAWVTSMSGFAQNFSTAEYASLVKYNAVDEADVAPSFQRLNIVGGNIVAVVDAGVLQSGIESPSGPHGDYATTTSKCQVCHSAHQAAAPPAGENWKLLSTSVADACTYCHIDINQRSSMKVYAGSAANYNELPAQDAPVSSAHRTNIINGIQYGAACSDCHSVHASPAAMTGNAALDGSILRRPAAMSEAELAALAADANANTALSTWCLGCHNIPEAPHHETHVITASVTTTGTAERPVEGCISCHGAGADTSAFPHYVEGAAKFLLSAASPTAEETFAEKATQDGVCLRCHSL